MSTHKFSDCAAAVALVCLASVAVADGPGLGKPMTAAELAAWDINILPDGRGLPPGSGTPAQGARIYAEKCVACHGESGKGGPNSALVGGTPLTSMETVKTIANFWPYATTIFDYVRRAMPWQQPKTLTNDDIVQLERYLLAQPPDIQQIDVLSAKLP